MWESSKTVAPTPNSALVQIDVVDNFVINSTHLKMILENKFDGTQRADPHDHIREFLAICDMFRYGETQSKAVKLLIFPFSFPNQAIQFLDDKVLFKLNWSTKSQNEHHQKSVAFADGSNSNDDNSRLMETLEALTIKMDSKFHNLNEEMHEMRKNYNNRGGDYASKNDDTPMCERHEVNYIQSEELNNDVKNDLEDFKRCIHSMRTVHDKLFDRDDQSKTDLEKSITKFLDSQRISNIKVDEWSKSQNISSEQTDRTEPPPPPQAQTEHVNAVFTGSEKSDDSPKIQKDPPPPIIVNNKNEKDEPIKT
ncbi:hypothetical protein Tco_1031504 [Tanacetum coccineum]|uniref:Reverse transcriptase domain-containing protein n=1 Tax=Tanacetum coccineum TaxID=301880 RepID=A0ABQ5GAW6_9ASTR